MERLAFLLVLVSVYQVSGEPVDFQNCENYSNKHCSISQVRITPCPEASKKEPCKIYGGTLATIEFDFTTIANLSDLVAEVFDVKWDGDSIWYGFDKKGCKYTSCPTTGGQQTYKFNMTISKILSMFAGKHTTKWKLSKKDKKKDIMLCCFTTEIELVFNKTYGV